MILCTLKHAQTQTQYEIRKRTAYSVVLLQAHPTGGQSPIYFTWPLDGIENETDTDLEYKPARVVEYFTDPQVDHDQLEQEDNRYPGAM